MCQSGRSPLSSVSDLSAGRRHWSEVSEGACARGIAVRLPLPWLSRHFPRLSASPVGEVYDDGGFSGATLERPAFQRLLKQDC